MEGVSLAEIMHVHTSGGRAMAARDQMGIHRDETSGALEEDRFACGILRTWEQLRPALI